MARARRQKSGGSPAFGERPGGGSGPSHRNKASVEALLASSHSIIVIFYSSSLSTATADGRRTHGLPAARRQELMDLLVARVHDVRARRSRGRRVVLVLRRRRLAWIFPGDGDRRVRACVRRGNLK